MTINFRDPHGSADEYQRKIDFVRDSINRIDSLESDWANRPVAQQVRIAGYRVIDVTKVLRNFLHSRRCLPSRQTKTWPPRHSLQRNARSHSSAERRIDRKAQI